MTIWIPIKFPSLNEYINAERRHRMIAAKMKKNFTQLVASAVTLADEIEKHKGNGPLKIETFPVAIKFIVHEENKRRDIDNVSSMVAKFSLDGMVKQGLLPDDSQKYVNKIECDLVVDGKVGVEIIVNEQ
jgi:Holliday junction resolvase RusA-like endonuclease